MKRNSFQTTALVALMAAMAPAASAQTPRTEHGMRPGGGAPADRVIELRQELGLSDAQVDDLRRIQADLQSRNEPLLAQLAAAREKMQAERPGLTAEQREQMGQRRERMQDRSRAMRDSMRARSAEMTPAQREQARDSMRARLKGRRGTEMARPRVSAGMRQDMPEELRTVMAQLRSNTRSAMEQIQSTLTAGQRDRLRELRPATRREGQPARARRQGERPPRG